MEDDLFADAVQQLLADHCTPQQVRAIEAQPEGEAASRLWKLLDDAGFADALVGEAQGGAGLGLSKVFGVWALCGTHALPLPLAETTMARALLAKGDAANVDRSQGHIEGPITLAEGRIEADGSVRCADVSFGRVATQALVQHAKGWQLLPVSQAASQALPFCLDAALHWSPAEAAAAPLIAIALPPGLDLRTLHACIVAARMTGALNDVFQRSLRHANERQQFGRPIGKFQAIQHQLAVMSEHVFAARMAAMLGCASDDAWPDPLRVAVAKARCSQAALAVAEAGHAIHGAIGFTAEYDLQLHTRRLHAWRRTAGSESFWHRVAGRALEAHRGLALDLVRQTTDITSTAA